MFIRIGEGNPTGFRPTLKHETEAYAGFYCTAKRSGVKRVLAAESVVCGRIWLCVFH